MSYKNCYHKESSYFVLSKNICFDVQVTLVETEKRRCSLVLLITMFYYIVALLKPTQDVRAEDYISSLNRRSQY